MTQHSSVLLSTACFAPVQYFSKLILFKNIYIEQCENFSKQTYRNRYEILGTNGPVSLVVPVVKGRSRKIKIRDLQISYDTDWQRNHWRTIFSAYNSSPFFEHYKDDIFPFFNEPWKFLFEYNLAVLNIICGLLEIEYELLLTNDFEKVPVNTMNLREGITPKTHKAFPDPNFHPYPYTQVFSERFDFVANLSILDLIFNEGPNSLSILENSV